MSRAEFMSRLTALMQDVSPTEREEAIQYYNDYFDDAGAENEESVIAALGTPEDLARAIKAGLNDGGSVGEFTESGFAGYETRGRDEVMNPQDAQNGQNAHREKQDFTYGNSYGGSWYGDNQGNGALYGNAQGGSGQYNGAQGSSGYYGSSAQGGGQYGGGQSAGASAQKKGMSGGMLALVIVALILTSPVWIGIAGGLFGVFAGLLGSLFGIFVAFLVCGIVMIVVGIALFITGVTAMFSAPLGGLCLIGASFVMAAVGLVFLWLMVLVVGTVIPALVRGTVSLLQKIFRRGGAQA